MESDRKILVLGHFRQLHCIWRACNIEEFRVENKRQLWTNIGLVTGVIVCILAVPIECVLCFINLKIKGFDIITVCTVLPILATMLGMSVSAVFFFINNRQIGQVIDQMQKLIDTRNKTISR